MTDLKPILEFWHFANRLRDVERYTKKANNQPESSAEHSWKVALISFLIATEYNVDINISKSMKMILVHDLPEIIAGDVPVRDVVSGKVNKEEKAKKEEEALMEITQKLPEKISKEVKELWYEFEQCETKEARFTKALDKMDCIISQIEMGVGAWDELSFKINPYHADKITKDQPLLKELWELIKDEIREGCKSSGREIDF